MAYFPTKEELAEIEAKFNQKVNKVEHEIDSELRKNLKIGVVTICVPAGMTDEIFRILKQRYLSAGWHDVVLVSPKISFFPLPNIETYYK